jgi:hypothetical protein
VQVFLSEISGLGCTSGHDQPVGGEAVKPGKAHLGFEVNALGRKLILRPVPGSRDGKTFTVAATLDVDLDRMINFNFFDVADEDGQGMKQESRLWRQLRFKCKDAAMPVRIRVTGGRAR